jgi:Tol biopolymer transport system component
MAVKNRARPADGRRSRRPLRALWLLPLAGALLVSCSVRGAQMSQNSLLERFERKSGLIAFIGLDGNIATADQTGDRLTQLTADAGSREGVRRWYSSPTWSARGRRLAFVRFDQLTDGNIGAAILTTDSGSRSPQVVWESGELAPVYLYWSPDSRWISMLSQRSSEGSSEGGMELGLVDPDGKLSYKPLDTGLPLYWAWDPGNRFMLAHVGGGTASGGRLTLLDIREGTQKRNFNVRPTRFQSPQVSPDGERMLYVDSESGSAQLVLRDIEGPGLDVLRTVSGSAFFSFSRDGRRVAVMESPTPQLSADGTLRVLVPRRPERSLELDEPSVIAFFWAPNSRQIAYLILVSPAELQQLLVEPVFAADPEQLYVHLRVMDARSGESWNVATFPITRGSLSTLQFFDQYTRSGSIWSPDGNWLVFSAVARGGFPGIYLGSASGNLKPRFVTRGDLGAWSIR